MRNPFQKSLTFQGSKVLTGESRQPFYFPTRQLLTKILGIFYSCTPMVPMVKSRVSILIFNHVYVTYYQDHAIKKIRARKITR